MRALHALIMATLSVGSAAAQTPQNWSRQDRVDQLRGTKYLQFSLAGKYLTPPRDAAQGSTPAIVLRCIPLAKTHGHVVGKLIEGYVAVGAIMDSSVSSSGGSRTLVQYRLDDGKLQDTYWVNSTDFSGLFFGPFDASGELANLLYGHRLYHKENTSPPVRKVVIGVPEFLAGEIIMQFDMPDPTEVGEACGVIWHK